METIHLPLDLLRSLMFSFDEFWGERALSRIRSEPEPYWPTLVPLPIGKLLKQKDPDSRVFKVHLYPDHAEVWHIDHWLNSTSSKWNVVTDRSSSTGYIYDKGEGALLHNIKACIVKALPSLGDKSQEMALSALSKALRHAPKDTTDKIPGLSDIIQRHVDSVEARAQELSNTVADIPYKCRMAFVQAIYPLTSKQLAALIRLTINRYRHNTSVPINKIMGSTMILANRHYKRVIFEDSTIIKYYEQA